MLCWIHLIIALTVVVNGQLFSFSCIIITRFFFQGKYCHRLRQGSIRWAYKVVWHFPSWHYLLVFRCWLGREENKYMEHIKYDKSLWHFVWSFKAPSWSWYQKSKSKLRVLFLEKCVSELKLWPVLVTRIL